MTAFLQAYGSYIFLAYYIAPLFIIPIWSAIDDRRERKAMKR